MSDELVLGINIKAKDGASASIEAVGNQIGKLDSQAKKSADSIENANKRTELSFRSMLPHIRTASAALGVYYGVSMAKKILDSADAYTDLTSRLKLVSGTTQELVTAQTELFNISQRNRTPLAETATLYFRLADSMKNLGASQKGALGVINTISQAMRISGTNTVETAAAMLQLSQGFQKNKLDGDEFKSVMENAPRIVKALTDEFKINKQTLYDWSSSGKLQVDKLVQALVNQAPKIEAEFKTIPMTIGGAWTQLSNAILKYIGDADQARGTSQDLAAAISTLSRNLDTLTFIPAKIVLGWSKVFDVITQVRIALGDLEAYKNQFEVNGAISQEEYIARRRANPPPSQTPGAPSTPTDGQQPYFDGIKRTTEAMKTEAEITKELRTQLETLNALTQQRVEGFAKGVAAYKEQKDTVLKGLENQIKAQEDIAKLDMDAAATADEKMRISQQYEAWLKGALAEEYSHKNDILEVEKNAKQSIIGIYQEQIAKGEKLKITEADKLQIQTKIADAQTELNRLDEQAKQLNLDKNEAIRKAGQDSLEAQQKQQEFIKKINDELVYQTQLYDKLAAAKAAGASQKDLELLKAQADRSRNLAENVPGADVGALDQSIQKTETLKQKIQGIVDVEQSVREEQLRINQAFEESVQQAQKFAEHATTAFGAFGESIGKMVVGIAQFGQQTMQVQRDAEQQIHEMQKAGVSSAEKEAAVRDKAALKSTQYQVALYGNVTDAAKGFFKQGTKGYASLEAASKVFRMFEMAMAAKSAIMQIAGIEEVAAANTTATATKVAEDSVAAEEEGILGVIHQLTGGDPYTAIPRAAAVAAFVAAMGVAIGGASGGSKSADQKRQDYQKGMGTGTVLGDPTAQSQSISESLQILADNSSNDLNYSAAMLRAMTDLNENIKGFANVVMTTTIPSLGKIASGLGLGSKMAYWDPLFAKETKKVTDAGLIAPSQTLSKILADGFKGVLNYMDITREIKWLGQTVSSSTKEFMASAGGTINNEFTKIIKSMVNTVQEAGKAFGISDQEILRNLRDFKINIGKISLQGLSGDEASKAVSAIFSKLNDKMAKKVFPGLDGFMQVGEGYAKTFYRVAEGINRSTGQLEQIGMTAISYKDIKNKQGDVAAEIARQTIEAQANLGENTRKFVDGLTGSSQDIIDAYKKIRQAQGLLRTAGFGTDISREMANAAGGLDNFLSSLQDFNDKFLSDSDKLKGGWLNMADSFTRLGIKMPKTNAEFAAMLKGIDKTTVGGQKLFGAMLSLSGAFADLTASMSKALSDVQTAYDRQKALAKSLLDYVNGLSASNPSASPEAKYNDAKQQFQQTLAAAKAGDEQAQAALQGVAQTFLDASRQYNASTLGYADDLQAVKDGLSGVSSGISDQLSSAEQQISAINTNTGAVLSLTDAIKAYLDTQSAASDAAGSQTGVTDIAGANSANQAAQTASDAQAAWDQQRIATANAYEQQLRDLVTTWRINKPARRSTAAQIAELIAQINSSAYRYTVLQTKGKATSGYADNAYQVNFRAKGGYTPAGLAIVGEKGPELVQFDRPAQVLNARDTSKALASGDKETKEFLAGIKDELKALVTTQSQANPQLVDKLTSMEERLGKMERNQRLSA